MSDNVQPMATNPTPAKRTRKPRSASQPRPAFVVLQYLDDHGKPVAFDKKRVKIVAVERSAEKVMELTEEGQHPHAIYLRVVVPAGTRAGSPNRAREATPAAA